MTRAFHRSVQIDRLVMLKAGVGSMTTSPFRLPRARYTVFVRYDPSEAVRSFALVDERHHRIPDWSAIGADVGDVAAPLVQHELHAGRYRVELDTSSPTCSWQVQVVLNSMLSWRSPPPAWRSSLPPPGTITVSSGQDPSFRVARTGPYDPSWTVGTDQVRHQIHLYSLDLRVADGHAVHLGAGTPTGSYGRTGLVFLGAGDWTVEMKTTVDWTFVLTPVLGPTGGGSQGF